MNIIPRKSSVAVIFSILALQLAPTLNAAPASEDNWKTAAIVDASLAAPPSVTADAKIYGWTKDGKLALARDGAGPYTCVASGAFSIRVGKPALPYPDPMCLDQNAWSFIQALWSKKKPLPAAPGLVWMLAGYERHEERGGYWCEHNLYDDRGDGCESRPNDPARDDNASAL